jgi:hypothetical protein
MSDDNYQIHKRLGILFYFVANYFNIEQTCEFINKSGMNKQSKGMAFLIIKYYNNIKMLNTLSINAIYDIITHIDPSRRIERYVDFIDLSYFIAISKNETQTLHHLELIKQIINDYKNIKYSKIRQSNPNDFISIIKEEKLKIVKAVLTTTNTV